MQYKRRKTKQKTLQATTSWNKWNGTNGCININLLSNNDILFWISLHFLIWLPLDDLGSRKLTRVCQNFFLHLKRESSHFRCLYLLSVTFLGDSWLLWEKQEKTISNEKSIVLNLVQKQFGIYFWILFWHHIKCCRA